MLLIGLAKVFRKSVIGLVIDERFNAVDERYKIIDARFEQIDKRFLS